MNKMLFLIFLALMVACWIPETTWILRIASIGCGGLAGWFLSCTSWGDKIWNLFARRT